MPDMMDFIITNSNVPYLVAIHQFSQRLITFQSILLLFLVV